MKLKDLKIRRNELTNKVKTLKKERDELNKEISENVKVIVKEKKELQQPLPEIKGKRISPRKNKNRNRTTRIQITNRTYEL
jgi:uncharacterized coiled-coil DUF342 family protein